MTAIIQTEQLTKSYGPHRGIIDVDLSVEQGEVFGFLGPNGAGKTTTIRTLLDLIRPTSGRAMVFGIESNADPVAIHRRVGYIPGEFALYDRLTGKQTLEYFANLRGGVDPAYQASLVDRFELDPSRRFREYSKGNKQKAGVIIALQHRPELLILDEPTSGLDPLMEAVFQDCIRELKTEGRTVLLSSHILAEVEALCDRLSIIRAGRTEQHGTLQELRGMTRTSIVAEIAQPDGLASMPGVHGLRVDGTQVRFEVDAAHLGDAVRRLGELGVRSLASHPPTLAELFLRLYGDQSSHEHEYADRIRDNAP